jgi:hypothetical protein
MVVVHGHEHEQGPGMNAADEMKKMRDGRTGVKKVHRKKKESRVEKKSMKRVQQKKRGLRTARKSP